MMEVKTAIDNILIELSKTQNAIIQLDSMIYGYIQFQDNTDKYKDWMAQKIKENNEQQEDNRPKPSDNK